MTRILAIFLTFFALMIRAPIYSVESSPSKKVAKEEVAIQSTIVPDCNFEPGIETFSDSDLPLNDSCESIPCDSCPIINEPVDVIYDSMPNNTIDETTEIINDPNFIPRDGCPILKDSEVMDDEGQIHDSEIPFENSPIIYDSPMMPSESYDYEIPYEDPSEIISDEIIFDPPLPCYPPDQKFAPNGCPVPPGGCQPFNKCNPNINPYAPPPEGVCCPPAPLRGAHWGLNAATMILPIMLVVGLAAIILSEHSDTSH